LLNLGHALNTSRSGSLVATPMAFPDTQAGLVLYTPYSEYNFKEGDEHALAQAAHAISRLIQGGHQNDATNEMAEQLQVELSMTLAEREQLLREKETLAQELVGLRATQKTTPRDQIALEQLQQEHRETVARLTALEGEKDTLAQNLSEAMVQQTQLVGERDQFQFLAAQLTTELEGLRAPQLSPSQNGQELLSQLEAENENLRQELRLVEVQLRATNPNTQLLENQLEEELRASLKENARLQKVVGEFEVKTFQMERQIQAAKASTQWDTIVTIAQEMRQPMSSVVGYSDFLLSESVGILGALQRKFLERVKVSTERMIAMIEELVQIASVEAGHTKLSVGSFDLIRALDTAISDTSPSLREKNISLRMNIPDKLPKIQGDYEAVKLILTNLLQNAGTVTPREGEITINVGYESYGDNQDYVLVQITDSGGGIPAEDVQRVFGEATERAGKTGTIRGLGGSPLSLAFTKSLVEAHGGRIWVEAKFSKGSTFSILLPFSNEIPATVLANWRN
jgi:signal transduction histidine kinase